MIKDGADFIDIGAQSTSPNAEFLSAEEILRIGNVFL
jgi:dihydropteroate synthase